MPRELHSDRLPPIVAYWNASERCEFVSPAYERWFGAKPHVQGMHLREFLGEVYDQNRAHIQAALAGQRQEFERELAAPDGGPPLQAHVTYVPDMVGGSARGFGVLVTDASAEASVRDQVEFMAGPAQSGAFLGSLIACMAEAVIAIDLDLRVRVWSPGAERIFQRSAAEMLGTPVFALTRPTSTPAELDAWVARLLAAGTLREVGPRTRRDGTIAILDTSYTVLRDPQGEPSGIVGVGRDITDTEATREALVASDARYRAVVAAMTEGVVIRGANLDLLDANPAALELLGLDRAKLSLRVAPPELVLLDEDAVPREEPLSAHTLRTGEAVLGRIRGVDRPDGGRTWLSINTLPLKVPGQSEPAGVVFTLTDVTAARALHEREARLRYVIEGSDDAIWDLHVPTGEVRCNERMMRMLGYEPATRITLEQVRAQAHPDDVALARRALEACLHGETDVVNVVHRVRHRDGHYLWVSTRGKVVERDPAGRPVRLAGTRTDITQRHEAEQALRAALEENERLVAELRKTLQDVKTLSGLLPICMFCKKIRIDDDYWQGLERFISEHTSARFSHGLCPSCEKEHYPSG